MASQLRSGTDNTQQFHFDENCLFCKIVVKKIPAAIVYETEEILAFNDIAPVAPTHILVIPKVHTQSLAETESDELLGKVLSAVRDIAKKFDIANYRTVINTGAEAGQSVFHLHLHLIAGRALSWPPG
ncbi:MAG: histidine triad nucleotide-binding protein [Cyanobacteria bacterium P01_H01_bin.74]